MKFLLGLGVVVALVRPLQVQDPTSRYVSPPELMAAMVKCSANDLALRHSHTEAAATLRALSGTIRPEIALLIDGFRMMAADEDQRVKRYLNIVMIILVPAIAHDAGGEDALRQQVQRDLTHQVTEETLRMSNPFHSLEEQTAIERHVLDLSRSCEGLAGVIEANQQGTK